MDMTHHQRLSMTFSARPAVPQTHHSSDSSSVKSIDIMTFVQMGLLAQNRISILKDQDVKIVRLISKLRVCKAALKESTKTKLTLFYAHDERNYAMVDHEIFNTLTDVRERIKKTDDLLKSMELMVADLPRTDAAPEPKLELIAEMKRMFLETSKDLAGRAQTYYSIVAPGLPDVKNNL